MNILAFIILSSCSHDFYDEDIWCFGLYDNCSCDEMFQTDPEPVYEYDEDEIMAA
jgi:hypothetical protein